MERIVILTKISTFANGDTLRCIDANGKNVDLNQMFVEHNLKSFKTSSSSGNSNWICSTTIFIFTAKA